MEIDQSDHFDGRRFHNPNGTGEKSFKELFLMIRQRSPACWPKHLTNRIPSRKIDPCSSNEIAVTFIGQSTFLLQLGETNVLTDPIFSERCSPLTWLGPKRVRAPGIDLDDLPRIQLLLISHNHYDHLDLPSLRELNRRFNPKVVTAIGNANLLQRAGLQEIFELDWWQSCEIQDLRLTLTPAQHFSARHFWNRNKALWGGFMIQDPRHSIFFAGDTGHATHFAEIHKRFSPIDLALLPVGAFEPRWFMKDLHMNPAEAVQAFVDLNAKRAIGMHFGTFQLTDEGIDEPVRQLRQELSSKNIDNFQVLDFGEKITL